MCVSECVHLCDHAFPRALQSVDKDILRVHAYIYRALLRTHIQGSFTVHV